MNSEKYLRVIGFIRGGGILGASLITSVGSLLGIIRGSNEGFGGVPYNGLTLGETYLAPMGRSYGSVDGVRLGN